jgi:hypothetical protein
MILEKLRRAAGAAALAAAVLVAAAPTQASVVDLAFALDRSGSIGRVNYTTAKNGLANALGLIPTTGNVQYRVAVVSFGSSPIKTEFGPSIIDSTTRPLLQAAVRNSIFTGGGTPTAEAVERIRTLFPVLGSNSLMNIITDGSPNSTLALQRAVEGAKLDGWDGLSYEVIGTSNVTGSILNTAFPGAPVVVNLALGDALSKIPNPLKAGFVIQISDFADFEAAISAKVQRIVDDTGGGTPPPNGEQPGIVPLPAGGWLLLSALGGIAVIRRRRTRAA